MNKKTGKWLTLLVIGLLAGFTGSARAVEDPASAVVDNLHEALLASMREGGTLNYQDRSARLAPAIDAAYDIGRISRIVTGRYWKQLATGEQQEFTTTFRRLVIANYANNFDSHSGESFEHVSVQELKRGRKLVRTSLVKGDGERVSLDYILAPHGEGWRIINVIADGVSDLALKRADYVAILKSDGYQTLIDRINHQILEHGQP